MAFTDLSNVEGNAYVRVIGEKHCPENVMTTFRELLVSEFPMSAKEISSINADVAEAAEGCIYDLLLIAFQENDVDEEDFNFSVTRSCLLPGGKLFFDLQFIADEDEDDQSENSDEWE